MVPAGPGQFDVLLDGERIASRSKGWQRLLGGGWPEHQDVIEEIRRRSA